MSKKLTPADAARTNVIVYKLLDQAESDLNIAEATKRACELTSLEEGYALLGLPPAELEAKGWTKETLRVAIDGLTPWGQAPAYLRMAHERHVHRVRARENGDNSAPAAKRYVIPAPTQRSLESADSEPEDDEEP